MKRNLKIISVVMMIFVAVIFFSSPIGEIALGLDCNLEKLNRVYNQAPIIIESKNTNPNFVTESIEGSHFPGSIDTESEAGNIKTRPFSRAPMHFAKLIKCKNLAAVVKKYAQQHGIDEDLIWAVIRQESGFNPGAVSPKGAMGLMQLMPGTAAALGVSDPFDVEQNVAGGVKYLEQCLNQFDKNIPLALAAYNAGPGNVVKYQGCPPFAETRNYVASILQAYAGETIRENLKLLRVNYVIGEDSMDESNPPAGVMGLPWRIPLPNWKIGTPQCKLGSPHWKGTLRPF